MTVRPDKQGTSKPRAKLGPSPSGRDESPIESDTAKRIFEISGVVNRYSDELGLGDIKPDDKDLPNVRFFRGDLRRAGYESAEEGARISCVVQRNYRGAGTIGYSLVCRRIISLEGLKKDLIPSTLPSHSLQKVVGETPTNKELGVLEHDISDDELLDELTKRGVDDDLRRQVAAALIAGKRFRPLWDDRDEHEHLAHLNAPRFLKEVYSDLFGADGNLVNEEVVRRRDPGLVQLIQTYINDREKSGKGPGDAKGIQFSKKDNRGRPRMIKQRARSRSLAS